MILPFTKVFSLSIRLFTRPVVNYAKTAVHHHSTRSQILRSFLLSAGEHHHRLNFHIQKLFLSTEIAEQYFKPLSEEKALESGAEFLGEVLVYGVLMVWGLYEMTKLQKDNGRKEAEINTLVVCIREKMQTIGEDNRKIREGMKEIGNAVEEERNRGTK